MTSADFSQFVVTARLLSLKPRLRDLPSYGRTLSGLYPLGLLSAVRIVIGLLLLVQHCPCLSALYQVLVHRANLLPPTSFRFRLTADTLVFGCNLPTIRAVWGLAPVRARSCWANIQTEEVSVNDTSSVLPNKSISLVKLPPAATGRHACSNKDSKYMRNGLSIFIKRSSSSRCTAFRKTS